MEQALITIQNAVEEHRQVLSATESLAPLVAAAAVRISESLASGGKLLLCGNGGSACDAQHLAAEFVGRFLKNRRAFAAIALNTDVAALTAIGNDFGFEQIFARQIEALGQEGDMLIAISTSGNSPNVLRAVEEARRKELYVIGLTGGTGGQLALAANLALVVPSTTTARVQEMHILLGHAICQYVEEALL